MLGTLITSITSFYFGSKTASDTSGRPFSPSAPKLTGLDQNTLPSDSPSRVLQATGTGLQLAETVILKNDSGQFGTDNPSSNDTSVVFTVPQGIKPGKWDVVVKTRDGGEATLPGALTTT